VTALTPSTLRGRGASACPTRAKVSHWNPAMPEAGIMSRSTILLLLFAIATLGRASAVLAAREPVEGQAVQEQDPINPPPPLGFERRDAEEADQWVERQRARWRAEEDARARAKKQRKQEAGTAAPAGGVTLTG